MLPEGLLIVALARCIWAPEGVARWCSRSSAAASSAAARGQRCTDARRCVYLPTRPIGSLYSCRAIPAVGGQRSVRPPAAGRRQRPPRPACRARFGWREGAAAPPRFRPGGPARLLSLQRAIGNQAVLRFVASGAGPSPYIQRGPDPPAAAPAQDKAAAAPTVSEIIQQVADAQKIDDPILLSLAMDVTSDAIELAKELGLLDAYLADWR